MTGTAPADPPATGTSPSGSGGPSSGDSPTGGGETPKQRRDRELIELLNELRLAAPGVQVIFGFLLIVPFQGRFEETGDFERAVYGTSLTLVAAAAVLIIGAAVQHRLLFRRHFERRMLVLANWVSLAGLISLGLGMVGSVLFVTHYLFGAPLSAVLTALTAGLMLTVWYLLPLSRRRAPDSD